MRETSLHRELKFAYAGSGLVEVKINGYIADCVNENGEIIEIQTGSFAPLKQKLPELAKERPVRIVYPVIVNKYIELYEAASEKNAPEDCVAVKFGELLHKRKSPRKGNQWDLFRALVYAPSLAMTRNITIELAFMDVTERRVKDGRGSWRRGGASIVEREILSLGVRVILKSKRDYLRFVPFEKEEKFTARALCEKAGIAERVSFMALNVLLKMKILKRREKKGRAWQYTI